MEHIFRLYSFNFYNEAENEDDSENNSENNGNKHNKKDNKTFIVQMFGIDEKKNTYTIKVRGYKPFFYVKVSDHWTIKMKEQFISHLKEKIGSYYANSIVDAKLISRKDLYGFDNKKDYKFIFIKFANLTVFNKVKRLWFSGYPESKLISGGYNYLNTNIYIYEANLPPLLRFFHISEISPSGWVSILKKKIVDLGSNNGNFNFEVDIKHINPLNDKETRVPFKVMSFDIEADSSHGDFPLPIKTYKKLAANIVEYFEKIGIHTFNKKTICDELKRIILTAFGYDNVTGINVVYPKKQPNSKDVVINLCDKWLQCKVRSIDKNDDFETTNIIEKAFEKISKEFEKMSKETQNDDDDDDDTDDDKPDDDYNVVPNYNCAPTRNFKTNKSTDKHATVVDILFDKNYNREDLLSELNMSLNAIFPKLEGDKVTYIGSTFMDYGNKDPYYNHCIVLNKGDENEDWINAIQTLENDTQNTHIESYNDERDVLLAWQQLVQRENPEIIIGYNIFGFDYEFMFRRSIENNCVEEFLKLSRNPNEICGTKDEDTGKWKIEESSIQIASGQHDLHYIKMNGRIQIDLYNFYRRTENLTSYKLDYVAGNFIGDFVKKIEHNDNEEQTLIYTSNMTGLLNGSYIHIEEIGHTIEYYNSGEKFQVNNVDKINCSFTIHKKITPDFNKKIRWCLAKDDVSPKDIFRMTNGTADERVIIAKYCIQDCNLVHYLFNKSDILTGYIEMAKICSVPIDFLVLRGQGIKLQSLIANECRKIKTLMPVIEKGDLDEGYEGAIVLPPKCDLYLDNPVACNDYASLYPSSMISENLSHDSKVWTKEYDLDGNLIEEWGYKDENGKYMYDNLPEYEYVDVQYDTYSYVRKNPKSAAEKKKCGYKICRFAQFPDGEHAIMPSILKKLLKARKDTRKLIPTQTDEFMKQVLEQRQLGYKVTANSLYGGCGAKTSSFYEKDIAACTTAMGRKLLTYGKRIIEECYKNKLCETKRHGLVLTNAEYIYGDTDSVFYTFNLQTPDGQPIRGKDALEITIELAQEVGELSAKFLKQPHDFEYEKTFMPFCLLSKKRYVGMLYETDINKCKRKEMGIVLKRRDNAPIVKDVYGGIIDILMKKQNIPDAVQFLRNCLQNIVEEKYPMEKLIISKSLRSGYKDPSRIAHKVLADRMAERDPGNKASSGDRIPYVYIVVKNKGNKKILQGDKIETPSYVIENNLKIDYSFYITNQIMKPVQQLFALVLEKLWKNQNKLSKLRKYGADVIKLKNQYGDEPDKLEKKIEMLRCKEIKELLFSSYIRETDNEKMGNQNITSFFKNLKK
jgi:DNA polymerase elongation subunit (family B)